MILKCLFAVLVASLVSAGRVPGPVERIVNGTRFFIEEAPYQVAILVYGVHYCGGSIYSERIVLTAAHCLNGTNADNFSVRAGSSFANFGGQVVDVLKAYPHKDFIEEGLFNDIAVLYLKEPLKLNTPRTQSIELTDKSPKTGQECMVTGWGLTHLDLNLDPPSLRGVNLTISEHKICRKKYFYGVDRSMICAYAPGKDSCKGDSGGPLVSLPDRKLIGIVSWGHKCAVDTFPGVYASVYYFKDWILKAIDVVKKSD